jgi:hypothetical protein
MIDAITAPFVSLYDLVMNIFIFIIVTVILMIVLPIIAVPFLVKMFAVYLGKTVTKELGKIAKEIIKELQDEKNKTQIEKRKNV